MDTKNTLFGDLDEFASWKEHWKEMPEFKCEDLSPHKQITISFASQEDVNQFSQLIGQKITHKTDGIWFPHKPKEKLDHLRYKDTNEK